MIEPIQIAFEVDASSDHAFATWTQRIGMWWPADHTVSGQDGLEIVLEPRVGGRIFERTTAGDEHDWGEVLSWEPPHRLVYLWHLRRDRRDATEVEIRFVPIERRTRVEIEHRGWERLGERGQTARDGNRGGWRTLLPHYQTAVED
jgi:uncharacterized protein YndB with AHSA1/START domain